MNDFFTPLENTRPYLKMAIEGFAGSGKTFTSTEIVIGLHKMIKSKKPIAVFDTERRIKSLQRVFNKAGIEVIGRYTRSLNDWNKAVKLCEEGAADILLTDSITHIWENFIETYKEEKKRVKLQFQDWGVLKPKWKREFSDRFMMSALHIIFTGRVGFEYNYFETDEKDALGRPKKELEKTGIKMKAETETEYEPDIVVMMEKVKIFDAKTGTQTLKRVASVIKDGWNCIDGMEFENPTFEDFKPVIEMILTGETKAVELEGNKDDFSQFDDEGRDERKVRRKILLEEIVATMTQIAPGQTTVEKKLKVDVLERIFGTKSWQKVEMFRLEDLETGAKLLERFKTRFINHVKTQGEQGLAVTPEEIENMLNNVMGVDLENLTPEAPGSTISENTVIDTPKQEIVQPTPEGLIGVSNKDLIAGRTSPAVQKERKPDKKTLITDKQADELRAMCIEGHVDMDDVRAEYIVKSLDDLADFEYDKAKKYILKKAMQVKK